jgi:hypothetical protein
MRLPLRHLKWPLLFAIAGVLMANSCEPDKDPPTPGGVDINGTWRWRSTVYVANVSATSSVPCSIIHVGDTVSRNISIAQSVSNKVYLAGFGTGVSDTLSGTLQDPQGNDGSKAELPIEGSYKDHGGTRLEESNSVVSIYSDDSLSGLEMWSWTGTGGPCVGTSRIEATRIP